MLGELLSSDALLCNDGTLWVKNFPLEGLECVKDGKDVWVNILPLFEKKNIQISRAQGAYFFGPKGMWAITERLNLPGVSDSFVDSEIHPWIKQWKHNESQSHYRNWHPTQMVLFFETEKGVFQLNNYSQAEDQAYKLLWEGRAIVKVSGKSPDVTRIMALLDDGHVWIYDKEADLGPFCRWIEGPWVNWTFFQGRHVEQFACGISYIFILADGTPYLVGEGATNASLVQNFDSEEMKKLNDLREEEEANEPEGLLHYTPSQDLYFKDKSVIKIDGGKEIVMAWCKEGIFLIHNDSGSTPTCGSLILDHPDEYLPVKFFADKEVEDIALVEEERMFVLCKEGFYQMSEFPFMSSDAPSTPPPPQKHVLSNGLDRVPLFFDRFCAKKKLIKSTRSAEPLPKRQKAE